MARLRTRTALYVGLALAFGWFARAALIPIEPRTLHLSGDGRDAVASTLFAGNAVMSVDSAEAATTQVVLLRRWQNLEALPELARLCGAACAARPAALRIDRPSLNGTSRVLLVDLSEFDLGPALDRAEPPPREALDCLVGLILREHLDQPAFITLCPVADAEVVTRPQVWTARPRDGRL